MNFCSNCGSDSIGLRIPDGDTRERFCCNQCGMIHYQNPNIIVGAIPVWENKVLLAKRNIEPRKGFWNLPCGFLELHETIENGAMREVKEETGIDIELTGLQTIYSLPQANQVYIIFRAKMLHSSYAVNDESSEIELFEWHQIPWDEIAFSSNTFALKTMITDLAEGTQNVHVGQLQKKY